MRIGIDGRGLAGSGALTGVSQYTRHLLRAMLQQSAHELRLFAGFKYRANQSIHHHFSGDGDEKIVWSPIPMRVLEWLWRRNLASVESVMGSIDLFFAPDFFAPPTRHAPVVATVHDLSFIRHPEWFPPGVAAERCANMQKLMRDAAAIIAVSNFTAEELADCWPQSRHKVRVIYEASGDEFAVPTSQQVEGLRHRLRLRRPFLLYVGTLETRKNIVAMIDAFEKLRAEIGNEEVQLVLAGKSGFGSESFHQALQCGEREGWILRLGYVAQQDLPLLYAAASGVCYLSVYEGFGLPPLEALACGGRVLAGDIPVLHEVLGNAAIYADPNDSDQIVAKMVQMLTEVRSSGCLPRAYSWQQAAMETLALFEEVAAG
ncbi:MAG: glycosyltransferase family 1 protein [Mariprofundales bacterium]